MMHTAVKPRVLQHALLPITVLFLSLLFLTTLPLSCQWTDRGVNGCFSVGQKTNGAEALLKLPLELCFQNT